MSAYSPQAQGRKVTSGPVFLGKLSLKPIDLDESILIEVTNGLRLKFEFGIG